MRDLKSLVGCENFAVIARTYIDDSADGNREKAIAAGAFIGKFGQWNDLRHKWNKRLKQDGLSYFRSTEYYGLRGEFSKFRDPVVYPKPLGSEAARSLREDLDQIIRQVKVVGVAVCIPLSLYDDIRDSEPNAAEIFDPDAFVTALEALMIETAKVFLSEGFGQRTRLAFFCDESTSSPKIAKDYVELKQINPIAAPVMDSLTFLDDKKYPQIQAADLMAHLAREHYQKWLENPDSPEDAGKIIQERLGDSVHFVKCMRRENMLEILEHERKRRNLV